MATLALFLALGGGAIAASNLGRNSVGTRQLKKSSVTTPKIKNGAVTGPKVAAKTLTGADIDASSLGTVPSAAPAAHAEEASAIDNQRLGRFSVSFVGLGIHEIIAFGGLKLTAECSGGNVALDATNVSGQAGAFQAEWVKEGNGSMSAQKGGFVDGSSEILSSIPGSGSGTATVSFADGSVTTLVYAYQNATQTGSGCHVFGRVIAG